MFIDARLLVIRDIDQVKPERQEVLQERAPRAFQDEIRGCSEFSCCEKVANRDTCREARRSRTMARKSFGKDGPTKDG